MPSFVPRALAAASAAFVQVEIILRSACATTTMMPTTIVRFRHINGEEPDAGLLQAEQEMGIA